MRIRFLPGNWYQRLRRTRIPLLAPRLYQREPPSPRLLVRWGRSGMIHRPVCRADAPGVTDGESNHAGGHRLGVRWPAEARPDIVRFYFRPIPAASVAATTPAIVRRTSSGNFGQASITPTKIYRKSGCAVLCAAFRRECGFLGEIRRLFDSEYSQLCVPGIRADWCLVRWFEELDPGERVPPAIEESRSGSASGKRPALDDVLGFHLGKQ